MLLSTLATLLQYVVPLALAIGAVISFIQRRKDQALHAHVASSPNRQSLHQMSWQEFERLVAETFRRKGYQAYIRGGGGADGGVDVELRKDKDLYLVQCKQWKSSKVGVTTVRELFGIMAAEGAKGGFVVTSGDFTADAARFAEGRSIHLVPAHSLLQLISGDRQPASSSAPACPLCSGSMVRRMAKKGANAGSHFWGCENFPKCRGMVRG